MQVDIKDTLSRSRIVPVLRKLPAEVLPDVVEALVAGGVFAFEITMDSPNAAEAIHAVSKQYEGKVCVGAGTVFTVEEAKLARDAGAEFLVSPHLDEAVSQFAVASELPYIPGVFTPTEIARAFTLGAKAVKVFPASTLGPGFIKDVRGPFGDITIMVTGGINEDNASSFIKSGATAVGMGSSLFPKQEIAQKAWGSISERVKRVITSINES